MPCDPIDQSKVDLVTGMPIYRGPRVIQFFADRDREEALFKAALHEQGYTVIDGVVTKVNP